MLTMGHCVTNNVGKTSHFSLKSKLTLSSLVMLVSNVLPKWIMFTEPY
jgi:hypothetical protein